MGRIDFTRPAQEIDRLIRGLTPWPSAYAGYRGKQLKIWRAAPTLAVNTCGRRPGEILSVEKDSVTVATGEGGLRILELQLEGKKRMTARDFLLGVRMTPGEVLTGKTEG